MPPKAHVIAVTTALALGYTAGFASDGLVAKAAVAENKSHRVVEHVNPGSGVANQLDSFIEGRGCDSAETLLGLDDADCDADNLSRMVVRPADDGGYDIRIDLVIAGSWSPGAPQ